MKTLKSLATHIRAVNRLALLGVLIATAPQAALAQTPILLGTFNNPAPAAGDNFGAAIAALGSDRLLVGAPYAGIVYLFHTNGTLLTTITKPPGIMTEFGTSITTLGGDRIVIGSSSSHVGLFTTNGAVVTIITNLFQPLGPNMAAVGNDQLLVGAPYAYPEPVPDWGGIEGAAFLYGTNGALLKTFFNPHPTALSYFGWSVRAFGSDRVLIGSSGAWTGAGGVFLFHTNGTLLTTFTNPAPSMYDYFGRQFATVGTDRILVSSLLTGAVGADTDEVHLFNTNGTLLLTITNPTPVVGDYFGSCIAVVGNDRVVISAPYDNTTGASSGAAYVFSLNGTLLATINNPAPGVGARFGMRLVPFGNDCVLISAISDNGVGAAYLFRIPSSPTPPSLSIQRTMTNSIVVSWPATATGFMLQQNTNSLNSVNWSNITSGIQNDGTNKTHLVNPPAGSRFYRLFKP